MKNQYLYPNLDIGDIIKKWKYINLKLLMKITGENKRYVLRQLRILLKQRKIIRIERIKYSIYVWKSKSNPFVAIFGLWDWDYHQRTANLIKIQLLKGDDYMIKANIRLEKRLQRIRGENLAKETPMQKELDEYIRKMFLSDKIIKSKSTFTVE